MKRILLDIETTSDLSKIHCCVTKDMDTGEVVCHTEKETLQNLLKQDVSLVGANLIAFDCYLLNKLWGTKITLKMILMDTLVLSRLLNPVREEGHSLNAWGKKVGLEKIDYKLAWENATGRKVTKAEQFDEPVLDILYDYCKGDVEVTERVYYALLKEQNDTKTQERAIQLEYETQAIIATQERNGFKLDTPLAMSLLSSIKGEMYEIESSMRKVFPDITHERYSEKTGKRLQDRVEVFNVGSRKQIAERLMGLGWKPTKRTEKGSIIVDETVLEGVDIPEAKFIARFMLLQKRASMLDSWLEKTGKDGRVHGKVITIGTPTGRATHSNPNVAQVISNDKELGKELRSCWIAPEGSVIIDADLAALEQRMLAHYMAKYDDGAYSEVVLTKDIHTYNQELAGLETRAQAKTLGFCLIYGGGDEKVGKIVGGGAKQGKAIKERYFSELPAFGSLYNLVQKLATKGWIPGLDGRRIPISSPHSALNYLLQSAGAIVSKVAMIEYHRILKQEHKLIDGRDYKQVAWIHDAITCEAPVEIADIVGTAMVQSFKNSTEILNLRCPQDGKYVIGRNLSECH